MKSDSSKLNILQIAPDLQFNDIPYSFLQFFKIIYKITYYRIIIKDRFIYKRMFIFALILNMHFPFYTLYPFTHIPEKYLSLLLPFKEFTHFIAFCPFYRKLFTRHRYKLSIYIFSNPLPIYLFYTKLFVSHW